MVQLGDKRVTESQKRAVRLCEKELNVKFEGDIESINSVKKFLDKYMQRLSRKFERKESIRQERYRSFNTEYGSIISRHKNRRG